VEEPVSLVLNPINWADGKDDLRWKKKSALQSKRGVMLPLRGSGKCPGLSITLLSRMEVYARLPGMK